MTQQSLVVATVKDIISRWLHFCDPDVIKPDSSLSLRKPSASVYVPEIYGERQRPMTLRSTVGKNVGVIIDLVCLSNFMS